MKRKYLVGIILAAAAAVVAFYALDTKQIEYATFARAASTGRMVQVKGVWVKDLPMKYENNTFSFFMQDDSMKVLQVVYEGGKPNNFEISREIVCKGRLMGDHFQANDILTKCPSKYQGTAEEMKQ